MAWKDVSVDVGKKVASGVKLASIKAAPALGTVASGVETAASGAKGLAWGAAATAGSSFVDAISDPGFILFIAGFISFFFNEYLGNFTIALLIATIFLFYSSVFIFKGKGIIITAIFWVWYTFFGGVTDPQILFYVLPPIVFVGMVAHGIAKKISHNGAFLEGAGGELVGLVPVLFFFLDLGLVPLLTKTFNLPLTPLIQTLILFTPWWGLLGLFTTKKENFFISLAKIIGIVYIFSILTFGVVPDAYAASKSVVPGPEEFLQAKKDVEGQIPQKENPAISNFACMFSEPTNVKACVDKRQEESELNYICKNIEKIKSGTAEFEKCKIEQKQKKEQEKLNVEGINDPTIKKPTKAEFKVSEYFPKTTYRKVGEDLKINYPIELNIENPRKQKIEFEVSCRFEQKDKNISGKPLGAGEDVKLLSSVGDTAQTTIVCVPNENLNGTYKLVYEAKFLNLNTKSRLQRAFIGTKSPEQKKALVSDIMKAHFPGKNYLSQAPADFAHLNFAFGNPLENPIIEGKGGLILSSTIENTGSGRILAIKSYLIGLIGFEVDKSSCMSGNNYFIPPIKTSYKEKIHLPTCFIKTLPSELQNPEDYIYREFEAELVYDYLIKKEVDVEVKVLTS
ncbi:MAG: hypothetical protein ABH824_00920 [Nanoarchaeota archaeon]|nr:hypothetical protein [Nanoarchaeota archaeon]MBU1632347.1 hypothetical protein [Nanoarchaeota archaeon]MBU1876661.1 hypothetical protein [Nanoarchaeota archaeon]